LLFLIFWTGGAAFAAQPLSEPKALPAPTPSSDAPVLSVGQPSHPFPPPAPAVVDPRSGAWQQHRGFPEDHPGLEAEEGVVIGAGRKQGPLERIYRFFHPYCPCGR
jgi:hypothetical protein